MKNANANERTEIPAQICSKFKSNFAHLWMPLQCMLAVRIYTNS